MLPKAYRLSKAAFQQTLKTKPVLVQRGVRVYRLSNVMQNTRIGFRINGRISAVTRNRIKRLTRESLLTLLPTLQAHLNIVLILQYSKELESKTQREHILDSIFKESDILRKP